MKKIFKGLLCLTMCCYSVAVSAQVFAPAKENASQAKKQAQSAKSEQQTFPKDFFDENRYIHIYTEDGRILVYEIFAAYVSGNEHLLMNYMLQTEDGFQSYLDGICEHTGSGCHFLEDRELTAEDRIITLSTCISGQETKRYLVQGVFIDEIEINN